jgi:hypothetical protein
MGGLIKVKALPPGAEPLQASRRFRHRQAWVATAILAAAAVVMVTAGGFWWPALAVLVAVASGTWLIMLACWRFAFVVWPQPRPSWRPVARALPRRAAAAALPAAQPRAIEMPGVSTTASDPAGSIYYLESRK